LGVAAQLAPEVVMLDIGLPGLNGHDVAAKLRHLPETRSAYLVAVTGYGQSNDRERALAAGFDAHFVKPIDVDALAAMLAARSQSAEVPPEATLKET
jgi:CheY-like chemotaxis protein